MAHGFLKFAERVVLGTEIWVLALLLAAWLLSRRPERIRRARALLAGAIVILFVFGTRFGSNLLVGGLEGRHPPLVVANTAKADAIVVLGGEARFEPGTTTATVLGTPSADRLVHGIVLWRAGLAPSIVVTGGAGDLRGRGPAAADGMRALALDLGVPESALIVDTKSRNTAENASEARKLLPDATRIVLVTSALHMPRSVALFRRQGFEVSAAPAGSAATDKPLGLLDLLPRASRLTSSDEAIHEYAGLLAYKIAGRL